MILSSVCLLLFVFNSVNFGVLCVTLKHMTVPSPVVEGESVKLKCTYDLEGSDLYSIKWYKNKQEFYRYIPKESPQQKVFDTDGVTIDLSESSMATVSLKNVGLKSSGAYKCEVSADAPDFQTKFSVKIMEVYVLPKSGPKILGGKRRYDIGDHVNVTCTSGKSKPPAILNWLINGDPPSIQENLTKNELIPAERGLMSSARGLSFFVKDKHLSSGSLILECISVIGKYSKTYKNSVHGGYRSNWGQDDRVMSVSQTAGAGAEDIKSHRIIVLATLLAILILEQL